VSPTRVTWGLLHDGEQRASDAPRTWHILERRELLGPATTARSSRFWTRCDRVTDDSGVRIDAHRPSDDWPMCVVCSDRELA
jgi:hypothetical protein